MPEIKRGKAPLTERQKTVVGIVMGGVLILLLVGVGVFAATRLSDGPTTATLAAAPLTDQQATAAYGASADLSAEDAQGNPLFGFSAVGEEDKPEGSGTYDAPEKRTEAFKSFAGSRVAAAKTANAMVLAMLNPLADQSFISALDRTLPAAAEGGPATEPFSKYLPSKGLREKFSDVRYSSFQMPMSHLVATDGTVSIVGFLDVKGTLRYGGQPRDFEFSTDYSMDAAGKLRGLGGFRLIVGSTIVTSDMLSLP